MMGAPAPAGVEFGSFDVMLIGVFFISWSVLALAQLGNLYAGRFALFAALAAGALALTLALGRLDATGFCAETNSAIVCGDGGRGLAVFGGVWSMVSAAALAMFALARAAEALSRRGR